jgi:hypothetical protein
MLVLRLVGALALIAIGAALVLYFFTRNRRYLRFAWRVLQFAFVFLLVFMAFLRPRTPGARRLRKPFKVPGSTFQVQSLNLER